MRSKEHLNGDIGCYDDDASSKIYTTINAQNNDIRTFILLGGQGGRGVIASILA